MNSGPGTQKHQTISRLGHARQVARTRLGLLAVCLCLPFCLVVMRMAHLSIQPFEAGSRDANHAVKYTKESVEEEQAQFRADILDRNGEILATSLKTHSLYADPSLIENPENLARRLSDTLPDADYERMLSRLDRDGRFVWLRRGLTPSLAQNIHDWGVPGLGLREEYRRFYPKKELTAHIIGYTGIDGDGLAGVEAAYDPQLRGRDKALRLSLDIRLQNIARTALKRAITGFEAKAGTAIILDTRTQDLLAAVSLPDYDPHHPGKAQSDARFNRLFQGAYELGSTFKLFSTAAYLEHVNNDLGHMLDATQPLASGRFRISDYHAQNRVMSIPEVFMHSSNIGVALMSQQMGTEVLQKTYQKFGFFDPLIIQIIEKADPIIPRPWRPIHDLTASFGHGLAVSPMHVAYAASILVNDGVQTPLRLTMSQPVERTAKRVVSQDVSQKLRSMMRLTVKDGTGGNAEVPGYSVGGKTGSAEKPGRGGYDEDRLLSSFLGVYPMTDPHYLIYVVVDEPQPQNHTHGYATGGWVAAPAVAEIIRGINAIMMVPPVSELRDMALVQPLYQYLDKDPLKKASFGHDTMGYE